MSVATVSCRHWRVASAAGVSGVPAGHARDWMRVSAGYQRIDGQWKVVHEHWSAPFDMETGTALFSLKP